MNYDIYANGTIQMNDSYVGVERVIRLGHARYHICCTIRAGSTLLTGYGEDKADVVTQSRDSHCFLRYGWKGLV